MRHVGNGWRVDALHFVEVRPRKMSGERESKGLKEGESGCVVLARGAAIMQIPRLTLARAHSAALAQLIYPGACERELFLADVRLYRALIEYQTTAPALVSVSLFCARPEARR